MSSESSDDEENLKLLREAVDPTFFNARTLKNDQIPEKQNPTKSLRKNQDEDDQFNELNVTPQFQKFVADRLSESLEKQLAKRLLEVSHQDKRMKKRKGEVGVKLLRNSAVFLDVDAVESEPQHRKKKIERRKVECETADVREAAVDPERILSKKDIKDWAKLYTKPHFEYRKNARGDLVLVEPSFK